MTSKVEKLSARRFAEVLELVESRQALKARIDALEQRKADLDAQLMPTLKAHGGKLTVDRFVVNRVQQQQTVFDQVKFMQALVKAGVSPAKIEAARKAATSTKPKKPFVQVTDTEAAAERRAAKRALEEAS